MSSGSGEIIERDADGLLIGQADRDEREVVRTLSADAEYKTSLGAGELVGTLNASRERTKERIRTEEEDVSVADEREQLWSGEGGAQFRAPLGSGTIETLAVHRIGRLKSEANEDDERFNESTRTSESIARAEFRRESGKLQLFGSVEGALNQLTSDASLTVDEVEVPARGFGRRCQRTACRSGGRRRLEAGERTTVEPSLRAEYSNIRSTGDSEQDDSFLFLKPRLRLAWDGGPNLLRATVEREVAQLDFNDFVATASLDRDEVTAGAASLRPPSTWSVAATYERRILGGRLADIHRSSTNGSLMCSTASWSRADGELFDAVGNIGDGTRRIVQAEWTIPIDQARHPRPPAARIRDVPEKPGHGPGDRRETVDIGRRTVRGRNAPDS